MSGQRVGGDGGATESCTLPDTPPDSDVEVDEQSPKSVPPEDSNSTPVSGLCFFWWGMVCDSRLFLSHVKYPHFVLIVHCFPLSSIHISIKIIIYRFEV